MKKSLVLISILIFSNNNLVAQGSSCSNAINIPMDGIVRTYSTSASTGSFDVCSNYSGTSPITWFRFTTNGSGHCPLINITAPTATNTEIALYTSCSGNMSNNLQALSSMCFDDGTGIWAPNENYYISPNYTYYLRIKTTVAGNISIGGMSYSPSNNNCTGATAIDSTPKHDNNACHTGGPTVTPPQLCASTLENTAFYYYYVATEGNTIININNISCDNGEGNARNGFQIGFFTGDCGSFNYLSCDSGSGNFVQATTPVLAADTKVYVAIDGFAGSNCSYTIQAFNAYSVMDLKLKYFTAWKNPTSNILKWNATSYDNDYFEIQRSQNGAGFKTLKKIKINRGLSDALYEFEDMDPDRQNFYRLISKSRGGQIYHSQVLHVSREGINDFKIYFQNPVNTQLNAKVITQEIGKYTASIVNTNGQVLYRKYIFITNDITKIDYSLENLHAGKYIFVLESNTIRIFKHFIKL